MSPDLRRPPFDPDLAEAQKGFPKNTEIKTPEDIAARRIALNFSVEDILRGKEDTIHHEERDIPGPAGSLKASIFRPKAQQKPGHQAPGILHLHSGGHCSGNRFIGLQGVLDWVEEFGAVLVSAEYRLTPEHPQPAQVEDSYAGLVWLGENAQELGVNPDQIIVCGCSSGGNLAAGVVLLARDRSGPKIRGQILMAPWLDDSNSTSSIQQFGDLFPWTRSNNIDGSNYALGVNREHATIYTVPSRAKDLSGLPPTFVDTGDCDIFRDEDIDYASTLWKGGVSTELHVWPGCWHGFDVFVPDAPISRRARSARSAWLRRLLSSE
ncbi:hypothetical protein PENDEC_c012G02290 [Penicillium decumbens]|uniref:Alpha/beta hydrolase fold-3 domain-containing protein n=1 Tax=Penicillium decumbens TaxID=69771 RepID=A0A1V6PB05_PENDC|nr:hypothetical protein PENDEC_c012G02290 [Penicillium decumbens]